VRKRRKGRTKPVFSLLVETQIPEDDVRLKFWLNFLNFHEILAKI
jgi:hypothetical protein